MNPLDKVFGFDTSTDVMDVVEIPDDPQLDHIIMFSLNEYKGIKDIIELVEPKNRIKYYEMMERFLANAKDAMYKKGQLENANKRLTGAKKATQEEPEKEGKLVDRNELFKLKKV